MLIGASKKRVWPLILNLERNFSASPSTGRDLAQMAERRERKTQANSN
jgi:hypothetical protein